MENALIESKLISDFIITGFSLAMTVLLPTMLGVMSVKLILKYIK